MITEYKEVEAINPKLYRGLGKGTVVAINPSMEELKALGRNPQKEPEYYSTKQAKDIKGNEIEAKQLRFDIFIKPENTNINKLFKLTYFLTKAPNVITWTKEGETTPTSIIMYIDRFGQSRGINLGEELKGNINMTNKEGKEILDANGKPKIALFYESGNIKARPEMQGETELIQFWKEFSQTPDPYVWDNTKAAKDKSVLGDKAALEAAEIYFSNEQITQLFKDFTKSNFFKYIQERIGINKINFIIGTKTSQDGKQFDEVISSVKGVHRRKLYSEYELNQLVKKYDKKLVQFLPIKDGKYDYALEPLHEVVAVASDSQVAEEVAADVNSTNDSTTKEDLPF